MNGALVVNGREDEQGRVLFVISAMYHCVDDLRGRVIRFVAVSSVVVEIAIELFAFDTGLAVEMCADDPYTDADGALRDAALYVGVALDDDSVLAPGQAAARGVPELVALMFPPVQRLSARMARHLACTQDPVVLARAVRAALA